MSRRMRDRRRKMKNMFSGAYLSFIYKEANHIFPDQWTAADTLYHE